MLLFTSGLLELTHQKVLVLVVLWAAGRGPDCDVNSVCFTDEQVFESVPRTAADTFIRAQRF